MGDDAFVALLWRRHAKSRELAFSPAGRLDWPATGFAAVLGACALLSLAGVDFPPAGFPFLIPFVIGFAVMWITSRFVDYRYITISIAQGRRLFTYEAEHRVHRIWLDELSTVSRERQGETPAVVLTDLRGTIVTVPLGTWGGDDRLLSALAEAVQRAGAKGNVGDPHTVSRPTWLGTARVLRMLGTFAAIVILVNTQAPSGISIEPVTPERIRETAGETTQPFTPGQRCEIYFVPLDRPSAVLAGGLSRALMRRVPVHACPTRAYRLDRPDRSALDHTRQQLSTVGLISQLADTFQAVWGITPATVLGVSELDTYGPLDLRFVFGSFESRTRTQGFGVISTARMGSGEDRFRRLETMALRYVGLFHFGLAPRRDRSSALFETIRGLGDLDRMRPQFSDPAPTHAELRAARQRLLAPPDG